MTINKLYVLMIGTILMHSGIYAGNGSSFGAGFGGGLLGGMVGNAITQPRSERTQVIQVPAQPPQPACNDYDDAATIQKLKRENRRLIKENEQLKEEVEELSEEITVLKKEIKKLKTLKKSVAL